MRAEEKISSAQAMGGVKQRRRVVSAVVFEPPDLALITRIRNVAEFAVQCIEDFSRGKIDIGYFVHCLRKCEEDIFSVRMHGKPNRMRDMKRYVGELAEEIASLLNVAAEAAVRREPINMALFVKQQVRIRYLSNALATEYHFVAGNSWSSLNPSNEISEKQIIVTDG